MAIDRESRRKFESLCFFFFFFTLHMLTLVEVSICQSSDFVLAQGQVLREASQLHSPERKFVLGFKRFGDQSLTTANYLAIWFAKNSDSDSKPVWIANRNSPAPAGDGSGSLCLTIDSNGSLKIVAGSGYSFSLFDVEESTTTNGILLDTGNFVLRELNSDGSVKRQLWQSFDYPTDTLLPGMKLGINHKTGFTWSLTSWKYQISPQSGPFTLQMDPNNTNHLLILLRGKIFWSSRFLQGGFLELSRNPNSIFNRDDLYFKDFSNENETYFIYSTYSDEHNRNPNSNLRLDTYGTLRWSNTDEQALNRWYRDRWISTDRWSDQDRWRLTLCPLLKQKRNGFQLAEEHGCEWKKQYKIPDCRNNEYVKFSTSSVMDVDSSSKYNETEIKTMYECQERCISKCDCVAFAAANEEQGTGCEIWSKGATLRYRSRVGRRIWTIYNWDYLDMSSRDETAASKLPLVIGCLIGAVAIVMACYMFYVKWKLRIAKVIRMMRKKATEEQGLLPVLRAKIKSFIMRILNRQIAGEKKYNLQYYSFEAIAAATNNFSAENKLGEGGFGIVYKGKLSDGQDVAVKRLSQNSKQGLEEFKNEAMIIAELQHTNLVKLVGCCVYRKEKLLIYEYMPNKSLDFFLFDPEKKILLDWNKRFNIIQGIVQGLLYLHDYSRLRIIHRDLKVNNILLDDEMNAKISDFGMARICESANYEANTGRVVGTHGYMSPEYIMEGIFSTKSDVYSFGVLLLEIITGKKNYNSYDLHRPLNLIGYAWELWVDGKGEELIDSNLCNSNQSTSKALRCIQISLLCVQNLSADRPTMLDIVFMIYNEATQLPRPNPPAFFIGRNSNSPMPLTMVVSASGGETRLDESRSSTIHTSISPDANAKNQ